MHSVGECLAPITPVCALCSGLLHGTNGTVDTVWQRMSLAATAQDPHFYHLSCTPQMYPVFMGVPFDEFNFFLHNISIDGVWLDAADTLV